MVIILAYANTADGSNFAKTMIISYLAYVKKQFYTGELSVGRSKHDKDERVVNTNYGGIRNERIDIKTALLEEDCSNLFQSGTGKPNQKKDSFRMQALRLYPESYSFASQIGIIHRLGQHG